MMRKRGNKLKLEEWIDTKLGQDIWHKKYQYCNETFDEWLDRISNGNTTIRRLIIEKKFLFGGRILANRGIKDKKVVLNNCFTVDQPEDNIESIYSIASDIAKTFSVGGGCGVNISKLSPNGAKVNNAAETTTGAVSFIDLYDKTSGLISQKGRRGALMVTINSDHPDLIDFINLKSDPEKATKCNMSVMISDEFMKKAIDREDIELKFTRPETGETITKTVNAGDVLDLIAKRNWEMAEPGMLFYDTINSNHLLSEYDNIDIKTTNPCVSGDTLILTSHGYERIDALVGKSVRAWNGYEFSSVIPKITGKNQPMVKIYFSDGCELKCTDYHKFILKNNERKMARDLKIGDKLIKCDFPVIDGTDNIPEKEAYTRGFYTGDGTQRDSNRKPYIMLYDVKKELLSFFDYDSIHKNTANGTESIRIKLKDYFDKSFVPDVNYTTQSRLDWLAGYIDSDGTLNSKDGSICISSTDKDVLMNVKYMLNTLGCSGKISLNKKACKKYLPKNDGTGENKEYTCKDCYRIVICASSVNKLSEIGLKTHRVKLIANPNRNASRFIYITKIEKIPDEETVYCFTEYKNHSGIFNGVITAQCGECPMMENDACLLGSLNLSEYEKNGEFNFNVFNYDVMHAIKALNEVQKESIELLPLEKQRKQAKEWCRIGLGVMGLADLLIKLKIPYGSKMSIELCNSIAQSLAVYSLLGSMWGEDKPFKYFDVDKVKNSKYFKNVTYKNGDEDSCLQSDFSLHNSALLAIAPTGSLSSMLGISGGIEPIYDLSYTRKTESLNDKDTYYKVYTPIVKDYMNKYNIADDKDLPSWFVTAKSIDVNNRLKMQATWQKYIDQAISSTVNLPEETTPEDIRDLYIKAWKYKLKGVTVYRDNCSRTGILSSGGKKTDTKKQIKPIETPKNVVGKKRKLITGCGSLHCLAFFDKDTGDLLETFLNKGSTGGCAQFMTGLSRMISLALRSGCSIYDVVDQLKSTGVCPSYAVRSAKSKNTSKGSCCPMAVANALIEMNKEMLSEINNKKLDSKKQNEYNVIEDTSKGNNVGTGICPECGAKLRFEGGCNSCPECGFSRCS